MRLTNCVQFSLFRIIASGFCHIIWAGLDHSPDGSWFILYGNIKHQPHNGALNIVAAHIQPDADQCSVAYPPFSTTGHFHTGVKGADGRIKQGIRLDAKIFFFYTCGNCIYHAHHNAAGICR